MKRKKIILLLLLLAAAAVAWYGYKEYTRINKDLAFAKADFVLAATDLIKEYESNDSVSAKKYNGKILEINGQVKAVEKDDKGYYTVVIGDNTSMSAIRCAIDSLHNDKATGLINKSSVSVRGACTGYNKDEMGLGSDIILNRCVLINKKD
jgi:uncharacterized protein (DUF1330 family)